MSGTKIESWLYHRMRSIKRRIFKALNPLGYRVKGEGLCEGKRRQTNASKDRTWQSDSKLEKRDSTKKERNRKNKLKILSDERKRRLFLNFTSSLFRLSFARKHWHYCIMCVHTVCGPDGTTAYVYTVCEWARVHTVCGPVWLHMRTHSLLVGCHCTRSRSYSRGKGVFDEAPNRGNKC